MIADGGRQALSQTAPRKRYRRFGVHNLRMGFRGWRRSRPFWAGLWTMLGGLFMMAGPLGAFRVIFIANVVLVGIMVGALTAIFGLFLWFAPEQRQLFGILIVLASIASFFTSDFGGFLIGMLLGMIGGSMGFAWVPVAASPGQAGRGLFRLRTVMSGRGSAGSAKASEPVAPQSASSATPEPRDAGDPATLAERSSEGT